MIPLFKPYIAPNAHVFLREVLNSGQLAQGPMVERFETGLRQHLGHEVLTLNSGTSALWLALDLAGVGQGDVVISTPMTCLATNLPILHRGAHVLWADVNPDTGNICPDSVWRLISQYSGKRKLRAVMCVDYGGVPCELESLRDLCDAYGLALIEDAAHAILAEHHDKKVGAFADFTCLSFQAIKHLTTGDGGGLICREHEKHLEGKLKRWFGLDRTQGGFRCEQLTALLGYKFHMNELSAALGVANLPFLPSVIQHARENAAYYDRALADVVTLPGRPKHSNPSWWLYTIQVPNRDVFAAKMATRGVQAARPHSRNDIQPIFKPYKRDLQGVSWFDDTQCAIPCGWWLSPDDREQVAEAVKDSVRSL